MVFLIFIGSVLVYLAGVPLVSFFGVQLALLLFFLWGLEVPLSRHLWGGLLAGALLDSYRPGLFGVSLAVFFLLAVVFFWEKKFLATHYFWGDFILVSANLIIGTFVFYLPDLFFARAGVIPLLLAPVFRDLAGAGILIGIAFLFLYFWYQRGGVKSRAYAR